MLSRVAESLYWIGRLTERAGHVAQLLDVHLSLWLDGGWSEPASRADFWQQFLAVCTDPAEYLRTGQLVEESPISAYVIAGHHPGGILAALNLARESARGVRETISTEVWEQLNTQYWQVREATADRHWATNPHAFLYQIKLGQGLLYGLVDETMPHDEAWGFLCFGRQYERAMNTAHLLDVKSHGFEFSENLIETVNRPSDPMQWAGILRSCWAFEAYRRHYASAVIPARVVEFLLLNPTFPRSVNFAIRESLQLVSQLAGTAGPRGEAERWLGSLQARLEYATIEEIVRDGLPSVLETVRERGGAVEKAFYGQFFRGHNAPSPPFAGASLAIVEESQQQQ